MSMKLLSDNELVKLYMNGNEESLSVLVKRHKRRIFSYIYLITRNKALTEDVFQETFFKVIQTLKKQQYNEEGKFLPWILRIAKNLIIDHFRKVKKQVFLILFQKKVILLRTQKKLNILKKPFVLL
jgi:RNA polymerase sigma factor (sigma-70 family)